MNYGGQEKGRREAVEADQELQQLQYQPTDRQTQLVIGIDLGEIFVCFLWQFLVLRLLPQRMDSNPMG